MLLSFESLFISNLFMLKTSIFDIDFCELFFPEFFSLLLLILSEKTFEGGGLLFLLGKKLL